MIERLVYPAIAERNGSGGLSVWFPDFPGCVTAVDHEDLDEAEAAASEVLAFHIDGMLEDGESLPRPTHYNRIGPEEVDMSVFWKIIFVTVDAAAASKPPAVERINATLPQALLRRIDHQVEQKKYPSRSGFLAAAARRLLIEG